MSTNKQARVWHLQASDLPEVKRRRHLENMLYTHKRVAQLAAEHRSHGLDDSVELYLLQLEVEQVLSDGYPDEFKKHIGSWAEEEARSEHHPQVTAENCSLCEAIAKHLDGEHNTPRAA